jgi:hypothetical protein
MLVSTLAARVPRWTNQQLFAADRECVQAELPRGFDLGNARIDGNHFLSMQLPAHTTRIVEFSSFRT